MAPDPTPARRKRGRPRAVTVPEPEPEPELEAELVPSPAPESSAKKRRLNSGPISLPSNPKGFFHMASDKGGPNGVGHNNCASKSVYDVLGCSDDEAAIESQVRSIRPAISTTKLAMRPEAIGTRMPKGLKKAKHVYDVPDSGDEFESPSAIISVKAHDTAPRRGRPARKTNRSSTRAIISRPGSASKPKTTSQDRDELDGSEEETPVDDIPSKGSARRGRKPRNFVVENSIDYSQDDTAKTKATAIRRLGDFARKEAPTPKGILTPRHKRVGRPRKSVAFDNDEGSRRAEVYFEDLPSKSKEGPVPRSKKASNSQIEEVEHSGEGDEEESECDDDEVCVICSKPDSKQGNRIVFCENCDKAFHQKCYNVPVIPEDDWFCGDCLQEDVISQEKNLSVVQEVETVPELPDIPNFEHHLRTMQRVLIDRCSGKRRIKLTGHSEAYDKAFQLVEQTVLAGEGNSMMIIGARGCGKTTLVEAIVSDLASESKDAFHVVRLNGFIHTDDKLALKEIWRQLGKEMAVEDDLKSNNYADILATLLALLSHPSEITGTEEGLTSKSVVFVIDEFDLFATHARQTLLYNLFDIAQARKAPIAVLGLTTRVDVVESLEKRVKSRFSHRYAHLSLAKSLPAYWDICKQGLVVDEDDVEAEGFDTALGGLDEFLEYWNQKIETLHKTSTFQDHLEYYFYTSKSVSAFLTAWVLPLSSLSTSSLALKTPSPSSSSVTLEAPDSKSSLLTALSDLDLALLIAAARLDIVAHTDTVNFAMAYDEYSSLMGKQRVQSASSGMLALGAGGRVWGRGVAGMAWERLITLGLLIPAGLGGRSNAMHGGLEGKMWKLDVALEEIPTAVELPGYLEKWCSQI